jgi:hypothetical protein
VGEIYRYVLKGPHMTPTQLRTVQEWTMERSLRTVPGVADDQFRRLRAHVPGQAGPGQAA